MTNPLVLSLSKDSARPEATPPARPEPVEGDPQPEATTPVRPEPVEGRAPHRPNPRIMILCGRAPRHLYVANRLCQTAEVTAIVHEAPAHWSAEKLRRNLKPKALWRKGWRWLRDRRRYTGNPEAKFFFGTQTPALQHPELVQEVPHINHPDLLKLAESQRPDLICVFGTSLIRGPLLERFTLVNLHGGLSPEYRGADCTFWALHNGEPEKVGCTLHFIDAGIDTGGLIAHVCPEIRPEDDELTLFWRAVRDSADVYADLVERFAQGSLKGARQPGKGRLYQVKDRTWTSERRLARSMRQGILRTLPPRVTWFGDAAPKEEAGT
jgi:methionyl-tRNA formyltransferase